MFTSRRHCATFAILRTSNLASLLYALWRTAITARHAKPSRATSLFRLGSPFHGPTRIRTDTGFITMHSDTRNLAAGIIAVIAGLSAVSFVFVEQQIYGRVPVIALPFIAWWSDTWWHGPISTGGAIAIVWGWYKAKASYAAVKERGSHPSTMSRNEVRHAAQRLSRGVTSESSLHPTDDPTYGPWYYARPSHSFDLPRPSGTGTQRAEDLWDNDNTDTPKDTRLYTPSPALARLVGSQPLTRTEVVKAVWAYIRKHNLQSTRNPRLVLVDSFLSPIVGNRRTISMFDMTKHISKHLS